MAFTDEEIAYPRSQPLTRLATVGPDGQPDVVPLAFEFDRHGFWVGGVGEAHRVLSEWPATGRGPVHAAALAACWSALTGQCDADMARLEFVRFAKERGILASEASDPAGWRAA